jgi:hypothetical protein
LQLPFVFAVSPRVASDWRARHEHRPDGVFAVFIGACRGLQRLFSPPQVVALEQPVPGFEPVFVLDLCCVRIDTDPRFGRRQPSQVLVRPDMVVEETKLTERFVQSAKRFKREPVELLLQSSEEALDPAVLPRAAGIGPLVTDAEQPKSEAKYCRREDRFVVGSE